MTARILVKPGLTYGDRPLTLHALNVLWGVGRWPSGRVWLPPTQAALSIRRGDVLDLRFASQRLRLRVRRASAPIIGDGLVVLDLVDPLQSDLVPGLGINDRKELKLDELLKRLTDESAVINAGATLWRGRGVWCADITLAAAVATLSAYAGATFWRDSDGGLRVGMPDGDPCTISPWRMREVNGDRWSATVTAGTVPHIGAVVKAAGRSGSVLALRLVDDGRARTLRLTFGALRRTRAPSAWSRIMLVVGRVVDALEPIVELAMGSQPQRILATLLEPRLSHATVSVPLAMGDEVFACLPRGIFVGPIPVFPLAPSKAGYRPEGLVAALRAMKIDTNGSISLRGNGINLDPLDGYVDIP